MRDYFFEIKTKGKEGSRVYTKCFIIYNMDFKDIAEIVKEEFSKNKLCIKLQVVEHSNTSITS
jgi:hypothetical protein